MWSLVATALSTSSSKQPQCSTHGKAWPYRARGQQAWWFWGCRRTSQQPGPLLLADLALLRVGPAALVALKHPACQAALVHGRSAGAGLDELATCKQAVQ